jgi:copper transport protein
MWRHFVLVVALLSALMPTASAHTSAQSISIADGAKLQTAPETVTITFKHTARFGSVRLETIGGERVPVSYTPPSAAATTFTIPFPPLRPDSYRVTWRVIATDGHVMTGAVAFTVMPS